MMEWTRMIRSGKAALLLIENGFVVIAVHAAVAPPPIFTSEVGSKSVGAEVAAVDIAEVIGTGVVVVHTGTEVGSAKTEANPVLVTVIVNMDGRMTTVGTPHQSFLIGKR